MGKIQIEYRSIESILPYEKNPRVNDEAVPTVMESIKEFGFKIPIVLTTDNVIVAGHTRIKAAKQLGMKEVPCVIADDLSEEQIKAFRLADNKSAEIATWDEELLQQELSEILDIDMSMFGFEESETDFADEIEDNTYTMKTNIPQYEITGEWGIHWGNEWLCKRWREIHIVKIYVVSYRRSCDLRKYYVGRYGCSDTGFANWKGGVFAYDIINKHARKWNKCRWLQRDVYKILKLYKCLYGVNVKTGCNKDCTKEKRFYYED